MRRIAIYGSLVAVTNGGMSMGSLLDRYGWHEWICHTNFSFLIGASHPQQMIQRAVECAYRGIAITDHDGVYGLARAYRSARHHAIGLRYGAEVHLRKDHAQPVVLQDTLILLALSAKGYENLCRLLTRSHREGKRDAALSLEEIAACDLRDIVALIPMRGIVRYGTMDVLHSRWAELFRIFGSDHLYAVVSRHLHPSEDVWIQRTYHLAKSLGVRILFSQDAYMHDAACKDLSDVLHAIRLSTSVDRVAGHLFANAERHLHSLSWLEKVYASLPRFEEGLAHSLDLAQRCQFSLEELRYRYPAEMIPEGYTAQSYLVQLVHESCRSRYPQGLPEHVKSLIQKELELVATLGFADYFLTVWDIVRWAREQNILCQGRGSAANSAICFVLGITAIDPGIFDVLFERFMSVERGDPPDIDVDFEHERREEVIQYIYRRYGRHRAAMVANVICFKTRGAIRFVGQALGVPHEWIDKVQDQLRIPKHRRQSIPKILSSFSQEEDHRWQQWSTIAERIKGFPRHLGIHSGGFILSNQALDALVAQEPATMPGRSVIQWCKEDIEALGFFKIDILALGMLTALRKSMDDIRRYHQRDLQLSTIPQNDDATYQMIQRADTVGVFQIESRAQMSMLPRLKPKCFYDLVVEVAIIRPGPITGGLIHPYLRRRDGLEAVRYAHPRLIPVLKRTLGVPIFQEQVMRIAMEVGSFSAGEADQLRRHMGSWQIKGDLGPWIEKLVLGMKQRGIATADIDQLVGQLKGFAEYGFPESHAASFALLAYASSYLKCHYPAAFTVALLNSLPMGFYSAHALVMDARRHGINILSICVQHSQWDSSLEEDGNGQLAIRLGLRLVHGLRQEAGLRLVERRGSAWRNLEHFMTASQLTRPDFTCLAAADGFRCFGLPRRDALWFSEAASMSPFLEDVDLRFSFPEESVFEKIQQDLRSTSTTLGEHPTLVVRQHAWRYPFDAKRLKASDELLTLSPGLRVNVFGLILVRQSPPTAKGMVFFTLEDHRGFLNIVFRPDVHERFMDRIYQYSFMCITGRLQRQGLSVSILAEEVLSPEKAPAAVIPLSTTENWIETEAFSLRSYF